MGVNHLMGVNRLMAVNRSMAVCRLERYLLCPMYLMYLRVVYLLVMCLLYQSYQLGRFYPRHFVLEHLEHQLYL